MIILQVLRYSIIPHVGLCLGPVLFGYPRKERATKKDPPCYDQDHIAALLRRRPAAAAGRAGPGAAGRAARLAAAECGAEPEPSGAV